MKKYIGIFIVIGSLYLSGCQEEEKIRLPETTTGIIPTVNVVPGKDFFDNTNKANAEVAFELGFNNFGGNLQAESIVVKVAQLAAITSPEALPTAATSRIYTTVTTFPSTVTIRLAEVARILGIADVNTITAATPIDIMLELRASNGAVYSASANNNAGANTIYQLGTFRRRFFLSCGSSIQPGAYTATAAVRVGGSAPTNFENQVRINRQVISLDLNTWLNFMPDIYTITDLSGGFYENNPTFPNTIRNQPVGIRDLCGTFSLFNNALNTLPSPLPQRTFTITSGSWNGSAGTLTLNWQDATTGAPVTISGTTTFVRTGD